MQTPDAHPAALKPAFSVTSVKVPSRLFLYRRLVAPSGSPVSCVPDNRKNVDPAVVVVVEECAPAADSFQNVLLVFYAAVYHRRVQSGGGSHVHEVRVKRTARRREACDGFDRMRATPCPRNRGPTAKTAVASEFRTKVRRVKVKAATPLRTEIPLPLARSGCVWHPL